MKYAHKELRFKLFGYGLYLGTVWYNLTGKKNYRWYNFFQVSKLVESKGASFWDKKYW